MGNEPLKTEIFPHPVTKEISLSSISDALKLHSWLDLKIVPSLLVSFVVRLNNVSYEFTGVSMF